MKRICFVTGTRAEYGLLQPLMKLFKDSSSWNMQLVVTGMHLSPEYGLTYKTIEKDGYNIDIKLEMLVSSDTDIGVVKSTGLGMISFADAFSTLQPDLLIVPGDRYEILSAVTAAFFMRIPIAHLHGGETTEGAFDEGIRHTITKMSYLHFVAADEYRNRVIQLGESPERVYTVGGIGIDNILNLELLSRDLLEQSIMFKLHRRNLLITFHPVTLEQRSAETQFTALCSALDQFPDIGLIFTKANSDNDGRAINKLIDQYVLDNSSRAVAFTSLGQLRYLSVMQYVDGVVGNSSSGIVEAPSMKVGTLNIGDRQKGRLMADSVIQCGNKIDDIVDGLTKLLSKEFRQKLVDVINPYGTGGTATKIFEIIDELDFTKISLKKKFYDLSK